MTAIANAENMKDGYGASKYIDLAGQEREHRTEE